MKNIKLISALGLIIGLIGCGPAKVLPLENIGPNETAFVIPLEGPGVNQEKFESVAYLTEKKVASKRIEIPVRERSTGRMSWDYEWIPTVRVIKVDRSLVTREWLKAKIDPAEAGKAASVSSLSVESIDSIGFHVGINLTAFIKEEDAPTYLYYHNMKPLSEVVDQNVRGYIQDRLSKKFGSLSLEDCKHNKSQIFEEVEIETIENFSTYGITISTVGNAGGLEYDNTKIQDSIDDTARAEMSIEISRKKKLAQDQENQVEISKASAENEIALSRATAQRKVAEEFARGKEAQESKTELDIKRIVAEAQLTAAQKWNGQMPASILPQGTQMLFGLDASKK